MATALTLMAKDRGDVNFCHQVLFCPVTDAGYDTPFPVGRPFVSQARTWGDQCWHASERAVRSGSLGVQVGGRKLT
jgi:hypothetical protein